MDYDKTGKVHFGEFSQIYKMMDPNVKDGTIVSAFKMGDVNGNGYMDFLEFLNLWRFGT